MSDQEAQDLIDVLMRSGEIDLTTDINSILITVIKHAYKMGYNDAY